MSDRSDYGDTLSSILKSYSLSARIYAQPAVCGVWQISSEDSPADACATFHLLGRGQGWLHTRDRPPQPLRSGDLVLFPQNTWNLLTRDPEPEGWDSRLPIAQEGPESRFICGAIHLDAGARNPIIDALPEVILVRAEDTGNRLAHLSQMMAAESQAGGFGSEIVLDKLADVLFVMAVRHHIEHSQSRKGLLGALSDPRIARALGALHRQPGAPWTVAELARQAGMSRTAFSGRFGELLGLGPIEYLTRWRMQEAERLLTTRDVSVAELAERLGYETDAAFRRAFKRVMGITPGAARRAASPGNVGQRSD